MVNFGDSWAEAPARSIPALVMEYFGLLQDKSAARQLQARVSELTEGFPRAEQGYEFLVDEGVRKARYIAQRVKEMRQFELMLEPETNIINYRFVPQQFRQRIALARLKHSENNLVNEANKVVQQVQRDAGRSFVSRTTLDVTRYGAGMPVTVMRAVLANPLATESDIEAVLQEQICMGESTAMVA